MIRIFRHHVPKSMLVLGTTETLILFGSVYLGITFGFMEANPTDKLMVGEVWPKAALYTIVMTLAMAGMGLYQRSLRDDVRGVLLRAGLALLAGLFFMGILLTLVPEFSIGSHAFTIAFLASAAGVMLFRGLVGKLGGDQLFRRRVLILGTGRVASQVEELRRKVDRQDMVLVGFVSVPGEKSHLRTGPALEIDTTLLDLVRQHAVDELVVGLADTRGDFPVGEILDCKMHGVRVLDMVTFFEQQTGKIKLDLLDPNVLIFSEGFVQAVVKSYVHRLFDILVSLVVLGLVWPLMLLTALLISLESRTRAPVFYMQTRVGRDGKQFKVLKFRSMRVDAEKDGRAQWAKTDDKRVTRVGSLIRKLRIDELPHRIAR